MEFQRRRRQAESLFEELAPLSPEDQVRRFGEERFQDSQLLDLFLEECHASQLADAARAEDLSHLAARLAAVLAEGDSESSAALARAFCLGANARRLRGDPDGADGLLARAVLFAELGLERAFYSRTAALVRWEQGRADEADALLEHAARLYRREGFAGEQADCLALLGLLRFEEPALGDPLPPLTRGWAEMDRDLRPFLALRCGLALVARQAERGDSRHARGLLKEVWPLFAEIEGGSEQNTAYWFEGRALGRLGDREDALQILESVRLSLIAEGRLAEAALVCVDLARLLAECERAEEIPSLAEGVETLIPEEPVLRSAGRQIRCLGELALTRRALLAEAAQATVSTLRTAFRGYRIRLSPIPFA